jgi:hypothetical protein
LRQSSRWPTKGGGQLFNSIWWEKETENAH